jgi:trehalose 6-phosphate phosphatase
MIDPFALPRLYPLATPPAPEKDWALFVDLDGTLLEIARTPDSVVVPHDLIRDLAAASAALGGALAVVSGRPLAEVDALLAPLRLPGAGEHGAVVRLPSGSRDEVNDQVPRAWVEALTDAAANKEGVLVERKVHSVVVHYRRAPRFEGFFKHLCTELIQDATSEFEILQGKMAVEIRPRRVTKARAVELLMQVDPFRERKPIFVGDDVTDQDGFRAAEAFGGQGLDVFIRFAGLPLEVRRWLKSVARL